ncbi:MAG: iron-containing alcohol dehydrogenase [Lentisphaeria bacterium]|nr:iron-containing alcohol dehydrogenase [Lentisphaeria bacterium]
MFKNGIDINTVSELRLRTTIYFGCGAINKINDIAAELVTRNIKKVLVISGRGAYKATGAWDVIVPALESRGIAYALYDKITPNPSTAQIDEAVALAADAQAVLAIGGGSPIDAGKSAAILLAHPGKTAAELYEMKFTPATAVPIIAVNLTHGTGTEADRFAVATILEKEYKPAIAYDCIYPTWSIDDPALMTGLSAAQTRFVSIDAINHCVEAATTKTASPLSISLAREAIALVAQYLPVAEKNPADLEARYYLLYASMLAGVSFDNGLLHFTHALEHPLSGVKPELTHGLGLAILLPAVIREIYAAKSVVLADILAPLVPGLTGDAAEAAEAAKGVEQWLAAAGVPQKLADEGFTAADIDKLVDLTFTTPSLGGLLALAPVTADADAVRRIYTNSLTKLA